MKILFLADSGAPHTYRWSEWFGKRGHHVKVVSFNPNYFFKKKFKYSKVEFIWKPLIKNYFFLRVFKFFFIFYRLKKIIKEFKPDLIHSHSAGGYSWVGSLMNIKPFVITPWGSDIVEDIRNSKINLFLTKRALQKADLVTTDAFYFCKILNNLGVRKNKIFKHMFGIDLSFFKKKTKEKNIFKINKKTKIIISTRTLNPVHNVEVFIDSMPIIYSKYKNVFFLIIGDGSQKFFLKQKVEQLGLKKNCYFAGMVGEFKLKKFLQFSDIYVSTSMYDAGLASSTAEAMAMSLPVVQTDNSDNRYWLSNNKGGFVFRNNDYKTLAKHVLTLLKNKKKQIRMGKVNRNIIYKKNNINIEMSKIEKKYKDLIRTNEN